MIKWLLISSVAVFLISGTAHAQLGQNLFIGNAKALALGHAVTADPPGIDSIHFNPAGLAKLRGRKQHLKFVMGNADIRADFIADEDYQALTEEIGMTDPTANTTSKIDSFAAYLPGLGITELPVIAAPLGGLSYQPPGSNLTFASAAYTPLILGYTRADDDPGVFYGRELGISRITYLSPTIGWQISDTLAVGAGIALSYTGIGLTIDYRAPNPLIGAAEFLRVNICDQIGDNPNQNLCGDAVLSPFEKLLTLEADVEEVFSPTLNVGILWEPTQWFSWGLVYQSEAADTLEGDVAFNIKPELVNLVGSIVKTDPRLDLLFGRLFPGVNQELFIDEGNITRTGSVDITIPQHIATGISVQLFPSLKFNLDYKWTETSKWEELSFQFDSPIDTFGLLSFIEGLSADAFTIPRQYEDAANWAYGLEYHYSDKLALRFGYEPRKSGIPDDKRDFFLPLADFDLYGLGFEYRVHADQVFDFAVGYGKVDEYVVSGESSNGNDVRLDNFLYNPSAGMDVHYSTEIILLEVSYLSTF